MDDVAGVLALLFVVALTFVALDIRARARGGARG